MSRLLKRLQELSVATKLTILGLLALASLGIAFVLYWQLDHKIAGLWVSWIGATSVFFAVCTALFSEQMIELVSPIRLEIVPMPEINDKIEDTEVAGEKSPCITKHLLVRDRVGQRMVRDCRILLSEIRCGETGKILEKFVVPRYMDWAPREIHKFTASFAGHFVLDFGCYLPLKQQFIVATHSGQGGSFEQRIQTASGRRHYIFEVEYAGVRQNGRHVIEVELRDITANEDVNDGISIAQV